MRQLSLIILILVISMGLTSLAQAQQAPMELPRDEYNMGKKLKRGAINVATAPLEFPKQFQTSLKESDKDLPSKIAWGISGIFKGIGYTMVRLGAGLWDVLTFNVEMPAKFEPVFEPEYIFDKEETAAENGQQETIVEE